MSQPNPGLSSITSTYADPTTKTIVVPSVITQSDQIALYLSDDLEALVETTGLDLADALHIPAELSLSSKEIILMLYEDIAHMLRDGLITGMHIIFSDSEMEKGTNVYKVRYHVHYTMDNPPSLTPSSQFPAIRRGGTIEPPKGVWRNARFALLIDWSPTAKERRYQVRQPDYCFDWVPHDSQFDAISAIGYREGGMAVDSANVVRRETTTFERQKDII